MSQETPRVLFIAGYVRSGSTLLDMMLGQTDGFFSVGEFNAMLHGDNFSFDQLCTCGETYAKCEFWKSVMDETFGGLERFDRSRFVEYFRALGRNRQLFRLASPRKSPRFRAKLAEYSRLLGRMYRAIGRVSGCEVIVDSSKVPNYGFALAAAEDIDLHVVHLVRDSRATAYSHQRKRLKPDVPGGKAHLPKRSAWRSALGWNKANYWARVLGRANGRYTLVRYEDLVRDPRGAVAGILVRLGVDRPSPPIVDRLEVRAGKSHNVAGNPMRFGRGVIDIKPDLEWRAKMSRPRKLIVTALTWPLLLKYGYPLNA